MEAVSKRGVCFSALLGVGWMEEAAPKYEVRALDGVISIDLVLVRLTVMNLVLFWYSSMLKV